ncbi:Gfo/Idh/MocA family protein [Paenibacillus cremeus]|uniref:Gfo/Idh/MocA family oxidoreductase n=1 Tax=Paenibacillus cremeus TaxID=2163881 RepID=A0A559K5M0_9BACL|nr:Gfo/Idh/MocA family oxidoreductase [Paenibacillus cremeus]TVY07445.1 Gfo/Idh/MocA family oxidoreductase [Paenibacillus cremeus]
MVLGNPQMVRWGVLGTGRIIGKAGTALKQSRNGVWLGVAGRQEESGRLAAERYDVPRAYATYGELLADPEIDAVYIALLNHLHYEWAIKACEAGKHVLVEKPFALNASEARQMAEAAQKHGVLLKEARVWLHYDGIAEIRKLLSDGTIGEWIHGRGHYSFIPDVASSRWNASWGGGALYDIGCYLVSWAGYFTGEEPEAAEAGAWLHPVHGVDSRFVGTLYFPQGKTVQIETFFDVAQGAYFELLGTQGKLRVDFRATTEVLEVVCTLNGGTPRVWPMNRIEPFKRQAESFAEAVLNARAGETRPAIAEALGYTLQQARVMDALLEAAERKCRVVV